MIEHNVVDLATDKMTADVVAFGQVSTFRRAKPSNR